MRAAFVALLAVAATWGSVVPGAALAPELVPEIAPAPAPRGNVEPVLDPVPAGEVGVVASSALVDGRVAVLVQNGTADPVRKVRVTGLATRPDGGQATKVTTQDLVPATLAPGAVALGLVDFYPRDAPTGSTVVFKVMSGRAPSDDDPAALDVGSLVLSAPLSGKVAQTLAVTVTNPTRHTVNGPVDVRVVCFGEASRPTLGLDTRVRQKMRAGASMRTTVKLHELCPSYLVAAKGESVR